MITLHYVNVTWPAFIAPAHVALIARPAGAQAAGSVVVLSDGSEIRVSEAPNEVRAMVDAALRPAREPAYSLALAVCGAAITAPIVHALFLAFARLAAVLL